MRLKRKTSTVIVLATILILLVSGLTPMVVMAQDQEREGGPGGTCGYYGCSGKFLVIICGCQYHDCYKWEEDWQRGKTLAEPVSLVGTCYTRPGVSDTYKLEIPEGTVVQGYYPGQGRVIHLRIKIVDGHLNFTPNLKLSQPATLYKQVDGEWVEVLSFTEVLNGGAS